ncbi:sortase B protein-sorting domain-containing protein [Christensenellaceae bacterium OttesenSCG-928-K19]|nr:sortase B protein-sorting domain-containing protein [Christensenellaceae bacterium OttesenSCG-928-K19]
MKKMLKKSFVLVLALILVFGVANVAQAAMTSIDDIHSDTIRSGAEVPEGKTATVGVSARWTGRTVDVIDVYVLTAADGSTKTLVGSITGDYYNGAVGRYGQVDFTTEIGTYYGFYVEVQGNTALNRTKNMQFTVIPVIPEYTLTVTGGTGGGSYEEGDVVAITAAAPADGKEFDTWTSSGGGTFADAKSASTTFTMPSEDVTITATYKDVATNTDPQTPADPQTPTDQPPSATAATTDKSPKTGDNSNLSLYLILMVAAGIVLILACVLMRKWKQAR